MSSYPLMGPAKKDRFGGYFRESPQENDRYAPFQTGSFSVEINHTKGGRVIRISNDWESLELYEEVIKKAWKVFSGEAVTMGTIISRLVDPQSETPSDFYELPAIDRSQFHSEVGYLPKADVPVPSQILVGLQQQQFLNREELHRLVLFAEVNHYTREEERALAPLLLAFIDHAVIKTSDDITVIGSAIRTYVSMLAPEDAGSLIPLLQPTDEVRSSPEIQLEIVKMIARMYEAHPPVTPDPEPLLADEVFTLAKSHLNPWVLGGEFDATIAISAVHALCEMLSPHAEESIELLEMLPPNFAWVRKALKNDLAESFERWKDRARDEVLDRFARLAQSISKPKETV